jgi:hypothetical protein
MPYIPQKFSQKNLNYFFFSKKIKKNNNFSHAVNLKYKLKNGIQKSIWYTKPLGENRCEAILETLTQELYRLVHPPQPKTRRAISTETGMNEYYVLSKEIPKFKEFFLSTENYKKILNNSITGLAAIQVLALWLNEIDFKSGNVGIDKDGHIIKIDGGLSLIKLNPKFKHLYEGKNLNITQVDLEALPNLQTYEACNWLHYIHWDLQKGAIKEDPTSSDKNINRSPNFKQELYQTILRIISLPNELIRFFTQNYITNPYDVTIVSEFIITRKEQLKKAAEQIPAFDEYRQSAQARKDMLEFLKYLKTFKTMGKSFLINEFEDVYKINFEATLFGKVIKEYMQIVKFVINFGDLTKELSQNILLFSLQEKFKLYIDSLNKIINEYFIFPTILTKEVLYETLKQIKIDLEKENLLENSTISDFLSSINNVLPTANENFKQATKPISKPQIKNTIQALSPINAFFNENYQKVSATYHQHSTDIQPHNFTIHY